MHCQRRIELRCQSLLQLGVASVWIGAECGRLELRPRRCWTRLLIFTRSRSSGLSALIALPVSASVRWLIIATPRQLG